MNPVHICLREANAAPVGTTEVLWLHLYAVSFQHGVWCFMRCVLFPWFTARNEAYPIFLNTIYVLHFFPTYFLVFNLSYLFLSIFVYFFRSWLKIMSLFIWFTCQSSHEQTFINKICWLNSHVRNIHSYCCS